MQKIVPLNINELIKDNSRSSSWVPHFPYTVFTTPQHNNYGWFAMQNFCLSREAAHTATPRWLIKHGCQGQWISRSCACAQRLACVTSLSLLSGRSSSTSLPSHRGACPSTPHGASKKCHVNVGIWKRDACFHNKREPVSNSELLVQRFRKILCSY